MSDHEHTYNDAGLCTNCGQPHEAVVVPDPVTLPAVETSDDHVTVPAEPTE